MCNSQIKDTLFGTQSTLPKHTEICHILDLRKMWHHFTFWGDPDHVRSLSVECGFGPVTQTATISESSPIAEGDFNINYWSNIQQVLR